MTDYQANLQTAIRVYQSLAALEADLAAAAEVCVESLRSGGPLLLCGNGGSASESPHLAGELMGRYKETRRAFAAIALSSNPAVLTCIGNDYCFDDIFAAGTARAQEGHQFLMHSLMDQIEIGMIN